MTEAVQKVMDLLTKMLAVRDAHDGLESPEEDQLLDDLDLAWYVLTAEDQQIVRTEIARRFVKDQGENHG